MYDLHPGIIAPVSFIAGKRQGLPLRDEAIALLSTRQWREGAWDSSAMATIARKRSESKDCSARGRTLHSQVSGEGLIRSGTLHSP